MNKPTSVDLTPGKQLAIATATFQVAGGWKFRFVVPGESQVGHITVFETDFPLANAYMQAAMEDKGYFVVFSFNPQ